MAFEVGGRIYTSNVLFIGGPQFNVRPTLQDALANCRKQSKDYAFPFSFYWKSERFFGTVTGRGGELQSKKNTTICNAKSIPKVASSGIASLLLPSGRAAHSRYKSSKIIDQATSFYLEAGPCSFRRRLPTNTTNEDRSSKMEVIASCISESKLWPHFKVFTLTENMRLSRPGANANERKLISSFTSWLLDIGDGKIGEPDQQDPENTS
ncbi:DNA helicase [Tanacetum coccineum]|uniref:ATP-dependent DNA helicase n=1 Tax=Tanacetum coccineum TaxID=301880 RepID=A0ABQ5GAB4_9ASTR